MKEKGTFLMLRTVKTMTQGTQYDISPHGKLLHNYKFFDADPDGGENAYKLGEK